MNESVSKTMNEYKRKTMNEYKRKTINININNEYKPEQAKQHHQLKRKLCALQFACSFRKACQFLELLHFL